MYIFLFVLANVFFDSFFPGRGEMLILLVWGWVFFCEAGGRGEGGGGGCV